jgi:hypothetical protein
VVQVLWKNSKEMSSCHKMTPKDPMVLCTKADDYRGLVWRQDTELLKAGSSSSSPALQSNHDDSDANPCRNSFGPRQSTEFVKEFRLTSRPDCGDRRRRMMIKGPTYGFIQ